MYHLSPVLKNVLRTLQGLSLAALVSLALLSQVVTAETVNTADDVADANDGVVSLREALAAGGEVTFDTSIADGTVFKLQPQKDGSGSLVIDKAARLNTGSRVLTIDASAIDGSAIVISQGVGTADAPVLLKGLKITGGKGTLFHEKRCGGGLLVLPEAYVCLESVTFENNSAVDGAGLYSAGTETTAIGCKFVKNLGCEGGAGAFVNLGHLTLTDCEFRENKIDNPDFERERPNFVFVRDYPKSFCNARGGGAHIGKTGSATIENCRFIGNTVRGTMTQGGGLYIDEFNPDGVTEEPNVTITNCLFDSNESVGDNEAVFDVSGAGAYANFRRHSKVDHCQFYRNICITCRLDKKGNRVVSPNDIVSTEDGGGGALYNDGQMEILSCVFEENAMIQMTLGDKREKNAEGKETGNGFGMRFGGGAFCGISGTTLMKNCRVVNNRTEVHAPIKSGAIGGGGIVNLNMNLTLENTLVAGNRVLDLRAEKTPMPVISGGLAVLGPASVRHCTIVGNQADLGAGIFILSIGSELNKLKVRDSIIVNNVGSIEIGRSRLEPMKGYNVLTTTEVSWTNAKKNGDHIFTFDPNRPLFTDEKNGDYTLAPNSQAILEDGTVMGIDWSTYEVAK